MNRFFFFVLVCTSISALSVPGGNINTPETRDARFIGNAISKAIEDAIQGLQDSGRDPIHIKQKHIQISLPVPVIFSAHACFNEIFIGGFSNIVLHKISFSVIRSRLDFDIELPLIDLYGSATFKTTLFGKTFSVNASGNIEIHRIRVAGQIQFHNFSSTVRSITIKFTLGGITSDVKLIIQGRDFATNTNYFIGTIIPNTVAAYNPHINELLAIILTKLINEIL